MKIRDYEGLQGSTAVASPARESARVIPRSREDSPDSFQAGWSRMVSSLYYLHKSPF